MGTTTPVSYRRVAQMTGAQLWEALRQPQRSGVHTLIQTEIRLRLDGLKRKGG